MANFIVISGRKSSGKTTTANIIKKIIMDSILDKIIFDEMKNHEDDVYLGPSCFDYANADSKVKIKSFAEPIKEICNRVLGLSKEQVYGTEEQKNTDTHIKWDTMPDEIHRRYSNPTAIQAQYGEGYQKSGPMTSREVMQIFGTDIMRNFFDQNIWANLPFKQNYYSTSYVIIDDCRFPNEADAALMHGALLIRLTRNVNPDEHASEKAMDNYPKERFHYVIENGGDFTLEQLETKIREILKESKVI